MLMSIMAALVVGASPDVAIVATGDDIEVYRQQFSGEPRVLVLTPDDWDSGEIDGLNACTKPAATPVAVRIGSPVSVPIPADSTYESLKQALDAALVERKKAETESRRLFADKDLKRKQLENDIITAFQGIRELTEPDTIGKKPRTPAELRSDVKKVPSSKAKDLVPYILELIIAQNEMQKLGDPYWWDKLEWHADIVTP